MLNLTVKVFSPPLQPSVCNIIFCPELIACGYNMISCIIYYRLLHEAISDESFRMPVSDVLHHHSLHSHILALLQFTLPFKVWLELIELVHQTLRMMIFKIMQQISYYPGPRAMWRILALEGT